MKKSSTSFTKISFLIFGILLFCSSTFAQSVPDAVLKLTDQIDTNRIKNHVTYLASDALLGRKPGKPGYQKAVDYVIEEYKKLGITPSGENGGFTQKVILRNSKLIKEKTNLTFLMADGSKKNLVFTDEYHLSSKTFKC